MASEETYVVKLCSEYPECETFHGSPFCLFSGDSDIAGIGIIVSFMVSSWSAYNLVVFAYLFIDDGIPSYRLNQLDRSIIAHARKAVTLLVSRTGSLKSGSSVKYGFGVTKEAIRTILLGFSDQQLVTAIAVLTVGFSQTQTMTEYHFEIISNLAWLSFSVYQCTAVVLSEKLQESLVPAVWRVGWIICLVSLLFASILITYNDHWLESYGTAVRCTWQHMSGSYHGFWLFSMMLALFVLLWGALVIIGGYLPAKVLSPILWPLEKVNDWVCAYILRTVNFPAACTRRYQKANSRLSKQVWRLMIIYARIPALLALGLIDTWRSTALDLLRIWGSGLAFTIFLFEARAAAPDEGMQDGEDKWGFGQGVAVFMLLVPIFGVIEVYFDERTQAPRPGQESTNNDSSDQAGVQQADATSTSTDESPDPGETAANSTRNDDDTAINLQNIQRQDTEARVGQNSTATTINLDTENRTHDEMRDASYVVAFRAEQYQKPVYRALVTLWMLEAHVLVTYLAVIGLAF